MNIERMVISVVSVILRNSQGEKMGRSIVKTTIEYDSAGFPIRAFSDDLVIEWEQWVKDSRKGYTYSMTDGKFKFVKQHTT